MTIGMKYSGIFGIIVVAFLFGCKPEEILLHGDITGIVTDAETSLPIPAASVKLINTDDTTTTGADGSFLLKNIIPDKYEIQSSKKGYDLSKKNVTVTPAKTEQIDFPLNGIPIPGYSSTCFDFGLDSTSISFTISNLGKGTFSYLITTSQNWITVSPTSGEITNGTDNIKVTINKTGLSDNVYNGLLEVTSTGPGVLIKDILHVNLNGVADKDCNYYKAVKIGTQIWMAENLNIGRTIDVHYIQANNGYIEKWCYDCTTYGGLYNWDEAMNYSPADTGDVGITRGICPVGWHIPTPKELGALSDYLSKPSGGKLKAVSSLWLAPNTGATNESGFTALPGGSVEMSQYFLGIGNDNPYYNSFKNSGYKAIFWTSDIHPDFKFEPVIPPLDGGGSFYLDAGSPNLAIQNRPVKEGNSVRCIKDPPKK